jgi:hypothetical protein
LLLPAATSLHAQAIENEPEMQQFTEAEIAAVQMPSLAFDEDASDVENYEKYFYFHRDETDFNTAIGDIFECDALASGLSYYSAPNSGAMQGVMNQQVMQYGMAGAIGGSIGYALGAAMRDAIFGSAERRKMRRENMRNCMFFKGYRRYGLDKEVWETFNFEEGNGKVEAGKRLGFLMQQALVASGPKPEREAIEP